MPQDISGVAVIRFRRIRTIVFDPRLVIGLLLVIGSIAGVVALVAAADETIEVYAARDTLNPGDQVHADDLLVRSVSVEEQHYLVPGEIPEVGVVLTRSVGPGELIPDSALGSTAGLSLTAVVVPMSGRLPESVGPGAVVDLWAAREGEGGQFTAPSIVIPGAVVDRLVLTKSIVGGDEVTGVELLVPKDQVARVLESVANDDALSIVPTSLPFDN